MSQKIDVPGMGVVEFPDGMSDDQISAAIESNAPKQPHSLLEQAGIAGGAAFKGLAALPLAFADLTDAPNALSSKVMGIPYQSPSDRIKELGSAALSRLGLRMDEPNTKGERLMSDAVSGAFSAIGGPGSVARGMIAGGAAGLSSGLAREGGAGAGGQIAAGLVGGMTPVALEGAARSVGGALANAGAAIGSQFGNKRAIERLASQAIKTEAGANAPRIAAANLAATEYVPGAKPTVAQAIAEANMGTGDQFGGGIVALEKSLSGARGLEDILPSVAKGQQLAIVDPLQAMAGGSTRQAQDAAQSMAKAARASGAGAQYEAIAPTLTKVDADLVNLLSSPAGTKAYEMARAIAKNDAAVRASKGLPAIPFELTNQQGQIVGHSAQGLQYVKEALDSLSKDKALQAQLGLSGSALVPIKQIRSGLVDWMNQKIPGWQDARTNYGTQSNPVNRFQAGQAYLDAYKNEVGNATPGAFANALGRGEDAFFKRATGDPRGVKLHPLEEQHIANVGKQLARDAEMKRIASGTNAGGAGNLASSELAQVPNLLNRTAMVVNFMLKHIGMGANIPVAREVAQRLADPKAFNELLLRPVSDPARRVAEALQGASMGAISEQQ